MTARATTGRAGAAALALALGLGACGDDAPTAPPAAAPASEVCADEEQPRLQAGSHLLGDAEPPVPYSSVPPTSGWHRSGAPTLGVAEAELSDPQVVSALEAGNVVVAYDPARTSQAEVDRLVELATGSLQGRLTVTAYTAEMPTGLAYLGWGVLRRCEQLDEAALSAFVLTHQGAVDRAH